MKISVIVPTLHNSDIIENLFDSLLGQDCEIEIFIIDQNSDNRLVPFIEKYIERLNIKHIKQNAKGISKARNEGLKHASGDIYNFIDDDGRIPTNRYNDVIKIFETHPEYSLISGPVKDYDTGNYYINPLKKDTSISPKNLMLINSNNIFLRAEKFRNVKFDEMFGVGSGKFGAGEESIYVYDLYKAGARGVIFKDLFTYHPAKEHILDENIFIRTKSYSIGFGAMFRRLMKDFNHYPSYWLSLVRHVIRPIGGMLVYLFKGDFSRVKYYKISLFGRLKGFFFYNSMLKKFNKK